MSDPRQPDAAKAPKTASAPREGETVSAADLQAAVDKEQEQGFAGIEVDPTPNENYTLKGVTSGAPTPETDPATKKAAQAHAEEVRQKVTGDK